MTLEALSLLERVSDNFQKEREFFSRDEIRKKINEIKYLSTQKKVPKLTLRKEIIHLENQFKKIDAIEKKLERLKKSDSAKIFRLKQQNDILKKRLEVSSDKDISSKVNKLSHLIGDSLAKNETAKEVDLARKGLTQNKSPFSNKIIPATSNLDSAHRANILKQRLDLLKQELDINKHKESENPERIKLIENMINQLEESIFKFTERHPESLSHHVATIEVNDLTNGGVEVRHDLIFHPPPPKKKLRSGDLPMPPPLPK